MLDIMGEVTTILSVTFSDGLLYMDTTVLTNQQKFTFISLLRIVDDGFPRAMTNRVG